MYLPGGGGGTCPPPPHPPIVAYLRDFFSPALGDWGGEGERAGDPGPDIFADVLCFCKVENN